jgi:hypothetical protein
MISYVEMDGYLVARFIDFGKLPTRDLILDEMNVNLLLLWDHLVFQIPACPFAQFAHDHIAFAHKFYVENYVLARLCRISNLT